MTAELQVEPLPLWLLNEEPDEESLALARVIAEGDKLLAEREAEKLAETVFDI